MVGDPLARYLAGELPAPVALMQLIRQSASPEDLATHLSGPVPAAEAARLAELRAFADRHPGAFALVHRVLDRADHFSAGQTTASSWATVFNAITREAPSAASALYALGDEALLDAASAEIVDLLRRDLYLSARATVADIGCGMGRLMPRLAEAADFVVGLDVSTAMLAEARHRLADARHIGLAQMSGNGLPLRTGSVDLALAIDVMPYVPADRIRRHWMEDLARVVRPGGSSVVMNWSYTGSPAEHCEEIAKVIEGLPLRLVRQGDRPFSLWDGAVFVLARL